MTHPTSEVRKITPALAEKMLKRNTRNRSVSEHTVKRYAEDMTAGRWKLSNDAICFNGDLMINGQHRLHAVIKSGVAIQCFVIESMDSDAFDVMDIGKRRSIGDALSVMGEKNANVVGAALQLIERYMTGQMAGAEKRKRYSAIDVESFLKKYPEVRESVPFGIGSIRKLCGSGAMPSACHYLFSRKSPEQANQFMTTLKSGAGLEAGDPIFILREALMHNAIAKAKLPLSHIMAYIIKGWNAWRKNRPMKFLRFQDKEEFPIVE